MSTENTGGRVFNVRKEKPGKIDRIVVEFDDKPAAINFVKGFWQATLPAG